MKLIRSNAGHIAAITLALANLTLLSASALTLMPEDLNKLLRDARFVAVADIVEATVVNDDCYRYAISVTEVFSGRIPGQAFTSDRPIRPGERVLLIGRPDTSQIDKEKARKCPSSWFVRGYVVASVFAFLELDMDRNPETGPEWYVLANRDQLSTSTNVRRIRIERLAVGVEPNQTRTLEYADGFSWSDVVRVVWPDRDTGKPTGGRVAPEGAPTGTGAIP